MFKIIDPNFAPLKLPFIEDNFNIVLFSDAHIGSVTGYLPSNCCDERGNIQHQTIHQELVEKNLIAELKKLKDTDILIFLGDMVEGKNSAAGGLDISNVNIDMQVEWAVNFGKCVIDILKPKCLLGLNGSDYHVENSADRRVIHRLSLAYPDMNFYYGNPSLKFELGQKLWWLSHQGSEGTSKGGTLERFWNKMNSKHYGRGRTPDVIGYGHIHQAQNPFQIRNGQLPVYGFVVPCLKVPDIFCSKGPTGTYWEIGFMTIKQDGVKINGDYVNIFDYWNIQQ